MKIFHVVAFGHVGGGCKSTTFIPSALLGNVVESSTVFTPDLWQGKFADDTKL